jgi:hypothetical protein
MEGLNLLLFPEMLEPAAADEQQEVVLRGVDDLETYAGLRSSQMFTDRLPFAVYLEFKKQVQR